MEIITQELDCLTMNAEEVAKKTGELICSPTEDTGVVKFSLDIAHPVYVSIGIMSNVNCDDLDVEYEYVDMDDVISNFVVLKINELSKAERASRIRDWLKQVDTEIASRNKLEESCYEAYRLDWMLSHGESLTSYRNGLAEAAELIEEDEEQDLFELDSRQKLDTYADGFEEQGFGSGSIWACMDEFLGAEFLDADYMSHLFDVMCASAEQRTLWSKMTGESLAENGGEA